MSKVRPPQLALEPDSGSKLDGNGLGFDYLSYPHIFEAILDLTDLTTLKKFRPLSKGCVQQVDRRLYPSIVVTHSHSDRSKIHIRLSGAAKGSRIPLLFGDGHENQSPEKQAFVVSWAVRIAIDDFALELLQHSPLFEAFNPKAWLEWRHDIRCLQVEPHSWTLPKADGLTFSRYHGHGNSCNCIISHDIPIIYVANPFDVGASLVCPSVRLHTVCSGPRPPGYNSTFEEDLRMLNIKNRHPDYCLFVHGVNFYPREAANILPSLWARIINIPVERLLTAEFTIRSPPWHVYLKFHFMLLPAHIKYVVRRFIWDVQMLPANLKYVFWHVISKVKSIAAAILK